MHDPILVLGVFSVTQTQFDLPVVAAILAVIGYSLNDTVIVFDRIRENFEKNRRLASDVTLDNAINQTLSRTIMTKVVTSIVVVALLLLGGSALRGFSEALLIGIIAGTYSSIYISSAIALSCGLKAEHLFPTGAQRPHRRAALRGELGAVMELLTDPHAWIAFITLSALEIVLGIDNIIFISILVSRLPPERRETARITGLALAMITRIALLFSIVWLTRLTKPWFAILGQEFSGPRHHPVVRRPVPARQERDRDPRHARRRGGRSQDARVRELHRDRGADRHHRHRVLARLGVHRGGPREARPAAHHGRAPSSSPSA